MIKPFLLVGDELDERRELHRCLAALPPRTRVAFLGRCCEWVRRGKGFGPAPRLGQMAARVRDAYRCDRADVALTNEVFCDVLSLGLNLGLDLHAAAVELERLARGRQTGPQA